MNGHLIICNPFTFQLKITSILKHFVYFSIVRFKIEINLLDKILIIRKVVSLQLFFTLTLRRPLIILFSWRLLPLLRLIMLNLQGVASNSFRSIALLVGLTATYIIQIVIIIFQLLIICLLVSLKCIILTILIYLLRLIHFGIISKKDGFGVRINLI